MGGREELRDREEKSVSNRKDTGDRIGSRLRGSRGRPAVGDA